MTTKRSCRASICVGLGCERYASQKKFEKDVAEIEGQVHPFGFRIYRPLTEPPYSLPVEIVDALEDDCETQAMLFHLLDKHEMDVQDALVTLRILYRDVRIVRPGDLARPEDWWPYSSAPDPSDLANKLLDTWRRLSAPDRDRILRQQNLNSLASNLRPHFPIPSQSRRRVGLQNLPLSVNIESNEDGNFLNWKVMDENYFTMCLDFPGSISAFRPSSISLQDGSSATPSFELVEDDNVAPSWRVYHPDGRMTKVVYTEVDI